MLDVYLVGPSELLERPLFFCSARDLFDTGIFAVLRCGRCISLNDHDQVQCY